MNSGGHSLIETKHARTFCNFLQVAEWLDEGGGVLLDATIFVEVTGVVLTAVGAILVVLLKDSTSAAALTHGSSQQSSWRLFAWSTGVM
eukprot:4098219-Amphidinium_carterae.4